MTKKKKIIIVFLIILLLSLGLVFLFRKKQNLAPKDLYYSNIGVNRAVVSFFTDQPVKSCVFLSNLKLVCQENKSNIHYLQLDKLKPAKKYHLIVFLDGFPFFNFLDKKITTLKTKEDKPPLIIKGKVEDELAEEAIVYFSDIFSDQIISTRTNLQGNFIVDLQDLTPIEVLRVIARNKEKEFVVTLGLDDFAGKELRLSL